MRRNIIIGAAVVAALLGLVFWQFFAPKATVDANEELGSAFDTSSEAGMPSVTPEPTGEGNQSESQTATTTQTATEDEPNIRVVREGQFAGADRFHEVSGTVKLLERDGQYALRFENYEATSGPDVYFYLTSAEDAGYTGQSVKVEDPEGTEGQATRRGNFEILLSVPNPEEFAGIVVWCEDFSTEFGRAKWQ